jgi:hypothetical protein
MRNGLLGAFEFSVPNSPLAGVFIAHPATKFIAKKRANNFDKRIQAVILGVKI